MFAEALTCFESAVSSTQFHGYGPRPIPHDLDGAVDRFIDAYLSATHEERRLLECLPTNAASVLLAFAERQATLAVRVKSKELLVRALIAVGLSAEIRADEREGMMILPLPWHSAQFLDYNPADVFKQAATVLPAVGAQALVSFSQRSPDDQTLDCMGYRTGSDEGGFRYVRTW
ncbi:MAG TPA: hypothetical protein DIT13_06160 [Verrucomicrobiales bacterium]|nr:hypothetical protein [Verrucomicrobiales bacterium]HRJ11118.1 hypothetical protein [Prosthecobacter sp.]HRK17050.1 hypothetical protein [Prosthecobacter sp.]